MGITAKNATVDLAENARAHAELREATTRRMAEEAADQRGLTGESRERFVQREFQTYVEGARRALKLKGHDSTPNYEEHGVAAPMTIGGESYQAASVTYERGGDRIIEAVRRNGPHIATKRVRLCVDGGERTRVVADARGG